MNYLETFNLNLDGESKTWLVTGVAGFIGSNLLETLLKLGQKVVGLDNFATGHRRNLDEVELKVAPAIWSNFYFVEGDIRSPETCREVLKIEGKKIDFVLHQAALGSVPRSVADPATSNDTNITGFLNMLIASKEAGVKRFVYAASSSTYGDHPGLPKVEELIGKPLSPYAVTKYVNELYADVFSRTYGIECIGLRYFNVFGPRQDPDGAYAAVIPKWIAGLIKGDTVFINGDGETSRDFCFVDNAVQANLLAATTRSPNSVNRVYNVAYGERTTLNQLYGYLQDALRESYPYVSEAQVVYRDYRAGDVRHSLASIDAARQNLSYSPEFSLKAGLKSAVPWYVSFLSKAGSL